MIYPKLITFQSNEMFQQPQIIWKLQKQLWPQRERN
jgi:hypothetical protein